MPFSVASQLTLSALSNFMVVYAHSFTGHILQYNSKGHWKVKIISIGVRAIFCQGGGGEPFAQKFSQVAQMLTKQSKRNEGHMVHQHRPSYEVKIFLHLNLSYELIKHVKRNSCLCRFDGQRYVYELCHC